jgi:hypothetical protein
MVFGSDGNEISGITRLLFRFRASMSMPSISVPCYVLFPPLLATWATIFPNFLMAWTHVRIAKLQNRACALHEQSSQVGITTLV